MARRIRQAIKARIGDGSRLLLCTIAVAAMGDVAHGADEPKGGEALAEARGRLLRGNYTEAPEQFEALAAEQPIEAAIGRSLAQRATGEIAEARATLQAAVAALDDVDKSPAAARLLTEAATLEFDVGDYAAAEQHVAEALRRVPDHLPARWLRAELHRVLGRVQAGGWRFDEPTGTPSEQIVERRRISFAPNAAWREGRHWPFN